MRKFLFIALLSFAVCRLVLSYVEGLPFAAPVHADYKQAFTDYNLNYDRYRNAYQDFISAKNSYLQYKTLNSQNEALTRTKYYLETRDDLLIAYYNLLKEKLKLAEGLTPYDKNLKINILDSRISFFLDHKNTIPAVSSLEDTVGKSAEIDNKKEDLQAEGEKTVGYILIAKEETASNNLSEIINNITITVNQIRGSGKDTAKLDRWLLETNNKWIISQKKSDDARKLLDTLTIDKNNGSNDDFQNAKKLIENSRQYLKEAGFNTMETIKEIKSGNY